MLNSCSELCSILYYRTDRMRRAKRKEGESISILCLKVRIISLWCRMHLQVKHFAADVSYAVEGFIEKNKDTVSEQLLEVVQRTKVRSSTPAISRYLLNLSLSIILSFLSHSLLFPSVSFFSFSLHQSLFFLYLFSILNPFSLVPVFLSNSFWWKRSKNYKLNFVVPSTSGDSRIRHRRSSCM